MDEIDLQLVDLLIADGRRTYADMASEVGLSLPAVKRRVDRLQETGVITGFTATVDPAKLGWGIGAFIELNYRTPTLSPQIEQLAVDIAEVQEAYSIAGATDGLCRVRCHDMAHLKEVINRIRAVPGVARTTTLMIL